MAMTVGELILILEEFEEDIEVRLAQQPRWPLEYTCGGVEEVIIDKGSEENPDAISHTVIYITEGNQTGYLPEGVAEQLGW